MARRGAQARHVPPAREVAGAKDRFVRDAVEGDLHALPFDDDAFDLVLGTEVLEHLDEPRAAVRELARVCAGHVLLIVAGIQLFTLGLVGEMITATRQDVRAARTSSLLIERTIGGPRDSEER